MQGRNKNDVLLTELVIVILVFSLVAVTVVQMFVAARQKSAHSGRLERALIVAQDWVERLSGAPDPTGLLAEAGFALAGEENYVLERAGDGLIVEARVPPHSPAGAGEMFSAMVSVKTADQAPLVALPVLRYIPPEEVRP